MKTIYSQRIDLNNWEILGIEKYFNDTFSLEDFIYSDKTLHYDDFAIYKISHGEDVYITHVIDGGENINYRLCLGTDTFHEITEDFDFITDHENIFETE